jgi:triacylglycerol lipase|tara:strand:+ start:1371 stop:2126 length:756 start_codon:yes stop_codon:yes gene_type:complete
MSNTKEVDWAVTELCSHLCDKAYSDKEGMITYLKENNIKYSSVKFFTNDSAQGYGIVMPDYVVIALRGTEPTKAKDMLADIKAWPSESDTDGKVHAGFKAEIDKLYPALVKWLKPKSKKKLIITGHSLGAAMATILASRLKPTSPDLVLYTFGCPRVGNREWGVQFDDIEAYRFVNTNDIIPQVPMLGYYRHVGQLQYISYDYRILTGLNWGKRFIDKVKGKLKAWSKFQLFNGVYDHLSAHYIKKIKLRK